MVVVASAVLVVLALSLLAFAGELSLYGQTPDAFDAAGFESISAQAPALGPAAMYVKFDGVDGESQDKDHQNWSDILAFSQGQASPSAAAGSTRLRGDCTFEDVVILKQIDKASPKLAEAVCKGKVFPTVQIHVAGSYDLGSETYYAYEFKNVQIVGYHVDGSTQERPTEEVAFNFEEIKVTYSEFDDRGRPMGNVEYSWRIEGGVSF
jgi:type VI secretion system secreted protein Hcp